MGGAAATWVSYLGLTAFSPEALIWPDTGPERPISADPLNPPAGFPNSRPIATGQPAMWDGVRCSPSTRRQEMSIATITVLLLVIGLILWFLA
jgi:hypothetical protein